MIKNGFAIWLFAMPLALAAAQAFAAPLQVFDDLGRPIQLARPPRRIISLEPSVTETLYAIGAGNKIIADDLYSDYPLAAKSKPHVNGIAPSREMVVGLHPDLIILFDQTFTAAKADQWSKTYGVPVYVTNANSYSGVEHDISRLGDLTDCDMRASSVVAGMERQASEVAKRVASKPAPKVFVVVWDQPLMTAGRETFIGDLVSRAGGDNIAAATVVGYRSYSLEQLALDDPDIILSGTTGTITIKGRSAAIGSLKLRAVIQNQCYELPDDWTVRPGPRLALGLLAVAKALHPDCFK